MNPEKIMARYQAACKTKSLWDNLYHDAMQFVCPQRDTFYDEVEIAPGQEKADGLVVFDSTAIEAHQTFASNLQSSLVPPFKRFIELKAGDQINSEEVADTLKSIESKLFAGIQNSNFDTQVAESFLDLAFGTGAFLAFKGTPSKPFHFVNVPLSQLVLEEGPNGVIETAYRKFKLPIRTIQEQWPDAKLDKELQNILKENEDHKVDLVESTYPGEITKINAEGKKEVIKGYHYCVVCEKSKSKIVHREMRTSPWIIFRWSTLPGEIYGRGPVLQAMPDIKTLNETKRILLEAADIRCKGMYTVVDDGVINPENIILQGGAMVPVSANPGSMQGPTISAFPLSGDINLAQIIIEDLRNNINKIMFGNPLGDVNLPVKTATEISLRQQDLAKRIGSAYGKLQHELIGPLIQRLLDIMDELGIVDLGDFKVNNQEIAIEHTSPLAQAQDEEDINRHLRYLQFIGEAFPPDLAPMIIKYEKMAEKMAELMDIDKSVVSSKKEIDAFKKQIMEQAQGMLQGQQPEQ